MSYPDCLTPHEQQQFNDFATGSIQRAERASRQRAYRYEQEEEHDFKENEHDTQERVNS